MEHSLNLAAKHFTEAVGPASYTSSATGANGSPEQDGNESDNNEFDISDTLGKALALVKQVLSSSSRDFSSH